MQHVSHLLVTVPQRGAISFLIWIYQRPADMGLPCFFVFKEGI